ncbi:hypothetical protein H109_07294 [Trichophyton interdigitale MR816]|uniref:Uncharacterized protein n=1 Tax=Trichophyton interdigitale (strain MR816) TaxID=1215338 RepID=A0A059IZA9_TRIIM|nr:hypothetical protein H109_07294 [Trichophyton interdigitale MR816]
MGRAIQRPYKVYLAEQPQTQPTGKATRGAEDHDRTESINIWLRLGYMKGVGTGQILGELLLSALAHIAYKWEYDYHPLLKDDGGVICGIL